MSGPGDDEKPTGSNYQLASSIGTMPKSKDYLKALRDLQMTRLEPWETWQRLSGQSSAGVGHITMVEPFSLKQKEKDVVYKYFSPMDSQRLTGGKNDPIYYEANASLEIHYPREGARWAWWVAGNSWRKIDYSAWKNLVPNEVEENEFGVVCP